jgi:hypothetical protein
MNSAEYVMTKFVSDSELQAMCLDINQYPVPKAYCPTDKSKLKAFVLGADPSICGGGSNAIKVNVVFGIGEDKKYFNSVNRNLEQVGLTLENVYVQNLVRNYMKREVKSNPYWEQFAYGWLPCLLEELNYIDPDKEMPVLVTDEKVLKFLLINPFDIGLPFQYYNCDIFIPIFPDDNKLERKLIPLYRQAAFQLSTHDLYRDKIKDLLH